jgi:Xaa-Pro dipeptidase
MLTIEGCRVRQDRLRGRIAAAGLDGALITDHRDILYFSGFIAPSVPYFPALLYIETHGSSWLVTHSLDENLGVDRRAAYPPHELFTVNPDLNNRLIAECRAFLAGAKLGPRVGFQSESMTRALGIAIEETLQPASWAAIDEIVRLLEKRKDPDEVNQIKEVITCSLAAYEADRAAIRPGVSELAVLEAGHRAATLAGREQIYHGGDYRAGEMGGPARDRLVEEGELYVIDAWTVRQGYWSDLCRTFAVGDISPLQRSVHDHIRAVQSEVPSKLIPGTRGTDLWRWMDARIREHPALREIGLTHHAGHGVGLRGHEAPDLNRDREGIIEIGDVLCVEPGAYSSELRGGVRIENTYHITENGPLNLSDYRTTLD